MIRPGRQFLSLASLTALEAIRQPIFLLLVSANVVCTALVPMMLMHHFGEEGKLARDSGLALQFVFGVLVTGYAASSSLAREMRKGTASAVLSKPVGRDLFFLAKFAGVVVVVAAFSLCSVTATLLAERISEKFVSSRTAFMYVTDMRTGTFLLCAPLVACLVAGVLNYLFRSPFESTASGLLIVTVLGVFFSSGFFDRAGRLAPFAFEVDWRILPAGLLVALALVVLAAIALGLSTRFRAFPTLSICAAVFLLGLMSDYLFGRRADASPLAEILYRVVPNWQHFWVSDALTGGGTIPGKYVLTVSLYAALCCAGILLLGLCSFRRAETE